MQLSTTRAIARLPLTSITISTTSARTMSMCCPRGLNLSRKSMGSKIRQSSRMPALRSSPSTRLWTHGTIPSTHCHLSLRRKSVTCISSCSIRSETSSALLYQNTSRSATSPVSIFSSTLTSKRTTKIAWMPRSSRAPTPGFQTSSNPTLHSRTGRPKRCPKWKDKRPLRSFLNALTNNLTLRATGVPSPFLESTRRTRSILIIYLRRPSRCILKPCLTSSTRPIWN